MPASVEKRLKELERELATGEATHYTVCFDTEHEKPPGSGRRWVAEDGTLVIELHWGDGEEGDYADDTEETE